MFWMVAVLCLSGVIACDCRRGIQEPEPQPILEKVREVMEMEPQENKRHKMTQDEEMVDLFNAYKPDQVKRLREVRPRLYRIWDISQKFLHLMNNMLVANPQNSNSSEQIMAVLPNIALDLNKQPIFMGLKDKTLTLSCVKTGKGHPQLQLVERHVLKLYEKMEEFKSFTFYTKTDGSPETCSFESAEFLGWFLSTSSELNRPIGLSRKGGAENILFYFQRKHHFESEALL